MRIGALRISAVQHCLAFLSVLFTLSGTEGCVSAVQRFKLCSQFSAFSAVLRFSLCSQFSAFSAVQRFKLCSQRSR
jgi:hypothetical protein